MVEIAACATDLIRISQLSRAELIELINQAIELKQNPQQDLLKGRILINAFFEPSTRTRLSFASAMMRLSGNVIEFGSKEISSLMKEESLADTLRMFDGYGDLVVIRHPQEGAAQLAADLLQIPVINGGDGANEHPTQTLTDLMTIHEMYGTLDGLSIGFAGDLKYGQAVRSLAKALVHFDVHLYFIAEPPFELDQNICFYLKKHQSNFSFHRSFNEVAGKLDLLYLTRSQKERHPFTERRPTTPLITPNSLNGVKKGFKILHPLPRNQELPPQFDTSPYAGYFEQAKNGLFVRQALMIQILESVHGKKETVWLK